MIEVAIAQGLFKLLLGVLGVIMARLTLLWLDKYIEKSCSTFATWIKTEASHNAKATYYAGRFVGVAVIIGCAIG